MHFSPPLVNISVVQLEAAFESAFSSCRFLLTFLWFI